MNSVVAQVNGTCCEVLLCLVIWADGWLDPYHGLILTNFCYLRSSDRELSLLFWDLKLWMVFRFESFICSWTLPLKPTCQSTLFSAAHPEHWTTLSSTSANSPHHPQRQPPPGAVCRRSYHIQSTVLPYQLLKVTVPFLSCLVPPGLWL